MIAFLVTSVSGFFTAFLVGFTALLPVILRRRAAINGATPQLGLHYCIGYTILLTVLVHMFVSMQAGMARGTSLTGLNLATVALLLIMVQVALGMTLAGSPRRRGLKAWHLVTMAAIVVLALAHIALNSALLQSLLHG